MIERVAAAAEKPPRVPGIGRAAFRAVRWILVVWLVSFGAAWYLDAHDGSWFGSVLLVLAVLLMFIGPGTFGSGGGAAFGGVVFMILGSIAISGQSPVQHLVLATRGTTVTATVAGPARNGDHGPWTCVASRYLDQGPVHDMRLSASAPVSGCVDLYNMDIRAGDHFLRRGEQVTVHVDPRGTVRPAIRYHHAGVMSAADYLWDSFVLGYPILIFGMAARTWRRRKREQLAKWQEIRATPQAASST